MGGKRGRGGGGREGRIRGEKGRERGDERGGGEGEESCPLIPF